jgi:hypothetical protein
VKSYFAQIFVALTLIIFLSLGGCNPAGPNDISSFSEAQREEVNQVFMQEFEAMQSEGIVIEKGAERGHKLWLEFSGIISLAKSAKTQVPALTLTTQNNLGNISQEKFLLASIEFSADGSLVNGFVFKRINTVDQAYERSLRFRVEKSDWIEDIRVDNKDSEMLVADIVIDAAGATKIGNLFAELQNRLEKNNDSKR